MPTFNVNGQDYRTIKGRVYEYSKGALIPCYRGDRIMLDAHCRKHGLTLHFR